MTTTTRAAFAACMFAMVLPAKAHEGPLPVEANAGFSPLALVTAPEYGNPGPAYWMNDGAIPG